MGIVVGVEEVLKGEVPGVELSYNYGGCVVAVVAIGEVAYDWEWDNGVVVEGMLWFDENVVGGEDGVLLFCFGELTREDPSVVGRDVFVLVVLWEFEWVPTAVRGDEGELVVHSLASPLYAAALWCSIYCS